MSNASSSSRPCLLLVEDNEINRAAATVLLAELGVHVAVARDGREAATMALANEYDAILMDCQMPELDGYAATARIRAAEGGRHVPIIAMAAESTPGERARCLAAGMDDCLVKPVGEEQLQEVLARWVLARDHGEEEDLFVEVILDDDEDQLAEAVDGALDPDTVAQLRTTLTASMRANALATFEDTLPVLLADIRDAAARRDYGSLRHAAHKLKGSAATLGAVRLSAACVGLEHRGRADDEAVGTEQVQTLEVFALQALEALREQLA
jgi:CheY-like chemotaxis protein/HPt (histidine-containing phosphotransfer) domain-containing protein